MLSNTLSFLSSRRVNDQVSHPYKTTKSAVYKEKNIGRINTAGLARVKREDVAVGVVQYYILNNY